MPAREPRVDARRNISAILDSARAVLAEDPDATLADIAERAEVHRTTLHRHFASREALIEQLTAAGMEALDEAIATADVETGDARAALRRATVAWFENARHWRMARYTQLNAVPNDTSRLSIRSRMVGLFERGQREGTIRDDIAPPALTRAWVGLVIAWVTSDAALDPEPTADLIIQVLLGAPSST